MRNNNGMNERNSESGLLTRCVPNSLKHSAFYRFLLRATRVLQFLSATISLGIFSSRVYKVYRLVNSIKTRRGVSNSYGAVEGILAAAVLYTLISMLMTFLLKARAPKWLRWLWVLLDILFVIAFIIVSVLTSPKGGSAGPRHCYGNKNANQNNLTGNTANPQDSSCDLPWGTFILAIISTLLHAFTAAFHEVRDSYKQHRMGPGEGKHMKHGNGMSHDDDFNHSNNMNHNGGLNHSNGLTQNNGLGHNNGLNHHNNTTQNNGLGHNNGLNHHNNTTQNNGLSHNNGLNHHNNTTHNNGLSHNNGLNHHNNTIQNNGLSHNNGLAHSGHGRA